MHAKRLISLSLILLATAGIAGCELLYAATGKGEQPPQYVFQKTHRVLVLVDVREGVNPPPNFTTTLAENIGTHLYRFQATDQIVPNDRLFDVQHRNPAAYKKMGVADIAQAADADEVLAIYITRLATPTSTDGTVAEGDAEVMVKVIARDGTRLWPSDPNGARIAARVDPAFTSDREVVNIVKELNELLVLRTGRMFHVVNMDDRKMMK